jgi:serine/threonine protein phosphatase PrpC
MGTRNTNDATPAQPQRASVVSSNNRVTLFKADEFGIRHDESPPFEDTIVGTYSCHGIEPDPNAMTGSLAKNNQDRGGIVYPFNGASGRQEALFLVLDGHGESGDQVSEFIMRNIVEMMTKHPHLTNQPVKALKESFISANEALTSTKINYITSGTTAVTCYMVENKLYVACAGDSRCVVAIDDKAPNNTGKPNDARKSPTASNNANHCYINKTYKNMSSNPYRAYDLSRDHKPDDPDEEARIRSCGGFVAGPREPGLSARVYLDRQCTLIGLAMSRSLGDYAVKEVGVTAEPEVNIHDLSQQDKFMIMASDGVWEFITSQEAVDIVQNNLAKGSSYACKELIQTAMQRWQDMEGDYRDDVSTL